MNALIFRLRKRNIINWYIIDVKVVIGEIGENSIALVTPRYFGDKIRESRSYGRVLRLIQDQKAIIKCTEDCTISIHKINYLYLETELPKKWKFEFVWRIKESDTHKNDIYLAQMINSQLYINTRWIDWWSLNFNLLG